jgi:hypothetical protein
MGIARRAVIPPPSGSYVDYVAFEAAAYAVLLSGPSGSVDIGGVMVHPTQGVTTPTVVLTPHDNDAADHTTIAIAPN